MHIIPISFHFNLFLFFIYHPHLHTVFLVFLAWVSLFFYSTTFWIPRCNFITHHPYTLLHLVSPFSRPFIALTLRTLIHASRPHFAD